MITITIPDIGNECYKCRFNTYGDLHGKGSNFQYCELFNTSIEYDDKRNLLAVKGCPNYKGNKS